MKTDWLKPIAFCMFLALVIGSISLEARAQGENNQAPILLIKIRNLDRLLSDLEKLMPKASQQLQKARTMLQGTDWIDSGRSVTAGIIMEGAKSRLVLMIPFSKANQSL